jgi:hypothetical protein
MDQILNVNPAIQAEIIQNLTSILKAEYVFPTIADEISILLQKHMEDGDYSSITSGNAFASALTLHIREVNHDDHLVVKWHNDPLPDQNGSLGQNQEWLEGWHQKAILDNFGIHKVERLPGNVGYLDIYEFYFPDWGGETAIAAMNFLAHTNSLIIDLRNCRGGDPGMVSLISTYLFSADRVHLNSLYWRKNDFTDQYWTLPYVPGLRYAEKPVYLLTSKTTFSGGEEFAYNLKTRQRAILVGETTGGGANIGAPFRLHPHFDVFIPVGRSINPVTGTNWEGTGVTPDFTTTGEQAYQTAYSLALKAIIADPDVTKTLANEAQTALNELAS